MTAAPDPMGQAARNASIITDGLGRQLLWASSKEALRAERSAALEHAFATWPKLQRAMEELLKLAPNAAAAGSAEDAKCVAFMEARDS